MDRPGPGKTKAGRTIDDVTPWKVIEEMATIQRVTIFGGDGFIGRHLVQRLAARGMTIIVYARRASEARFLKPMGDPGQIVLANGNIGDPKRVAAAIAGSDAVINLVGILREQGRQTFAGLQRDAAGVIAERAHAAGVQRLIHVSAIGADAGSPSRYARSKGEGETAMRNQFSGTTILRPSIVFGAEDQFFNRFAAMTRVSPVLPIVGATTRFQPVYVGDVAAAIVATLDDRATIGQTFELGGPSIYSFRALLELMLAEIGIHRTILDLSPALATWIARLSAFLPEPPITADQILLLRGDNVVAAEAHALADLGLVATPLERVLPDQLKRFRRSRQSA